MQENHTNRSVIFKHASLRLPAPPPTPLPSISLHLDTSTQLPVHSSASLITFKDPNTASLKWRQCYDLFILFSVLFCEIALYSWNYSITLLDSHSKKKKNIKCHFVFYQFTIYGPKFYLNFLFTLQFIAAPPPSPSIIMFWSLFLFVVWWESCKGQVLEWRLFTHVKSNTNV